MREAAAKTATLKPTTQQVGWRCGFDVGLVILWLCLTTVRAGANEITHPDAISSVATNAISGLEKMQKEVRVTITTNAPPTSDNPTNAPASKEKSFRWNVTWQGWEGLHLEAVQQTHVQTPKAVWGMMGVNTNATPVIRLEQVKLSSTLGARVEVDGAAFVTTDQLTGFDPGVDLRRLLFNARGDCILLLPVSYYLELGLSSGQFNLTKSYLVFPEIKYIGDLQIGQFQSPLGLQLITSSRDIPFMEPAAPLQAIAPGIEAGLQIGRSVFSERATWTFGLFAPGGGASEYGNASQEYGSAILRFTALPFWHPDAADPSANRYLHLGLSANILYSASSTVRYQSRPESFIAPVVIDTGDIDAHSAAVFGGEAAWVNGPLSLQGEFIYSEVNQNDGETLNFYGCYGQASWYLTGESRPYDPKAGAFKRLVPRHNFDFGKSGWGAWEIAARYSYTDLTDANVAGGRLGLLMAGVNWYLHPHVRWMFNCGMGRVTGGAQDGNLFIFQTRIGVDF